MPSGVAGLDTILGGGFFAITAGCTTLILTSAQGTRITPEHTVVDGIVELADDLVGWVAKSSLQVTKFRGRGVLRGRHAFKITNEGLVVHPRIEALLARPSRPDPGISGRGPSGIDQLDAMLGGGLPGSSTSVVMGPSGTGKTTFGLQFLSRSSEAEPGLMFGFNETPARLDAKIDAVCRPLRDRVRSGLVQVHWQPPTADLLDAYGERLLLAVRGRGVRRLLIDGLDAFRAAAAEPSRFGKFLIALTNELRVLGVTTLYTLEVPDIVEPIIRSPVGDLPGLAENLVLLRFVELRAQLHRLVPVLKVRDSQFDPSLREYLTSAEGLVIDPSSDNAQRITADYARQGRGTPSADAQPWRRRGGWPWRPCSWSTTSSALPS